MPQVFPRRPVLLRPGSLPLTFRLGKRPVRGQAEKPDGFYHMAEHSPAVVLPGDTITMSPPTHELTLVAFQVVWPPDRTRATVTAWLRHPRREAIAVFGLRDDTPDYVIADIYEMHGLDPTPFRGGK